MRRAILSITYFLLLTLIIRAQIWCPPGAEWTYTYTNGWTMDGFARFTYLGDTVIGSMPSQVIAMHSEGISLGTPFSWDSGPYFTTVDGDLVSIWTATGFDTLYHFGALPGEQWNLTTEEGTPGWVPVLVTDTGSAIVDGIPLHYLVAGTDTIMERLGSLHHLMLPWVTFTLDAPDGLLRCYQDVDIDFIAPGWDYGCDTWTDVSASPSRADAIPFPNPGTDHFTLLLPPGRKDIVLVDATGRIVLRSAVGDEQVRVDTSHLGPGVYTYRLMDQSGRILAQGHWQRM